MAKSPYKPPYEIESSHSVNTINVRLTQEYVREAERYGISNPIIYALQQETSTLWRISDCGVALEVTPPYRSCVISAHILKLLREYQETGVMPECEFEVRLQDNTL